MATPAYKGKGQPAIDNGWLSGFGSWFSVQAPVYAGAGQSAAAGSGYLSGATPAYKPAPSSQDDDAPACAVAQDERITLVIPRELIDSQR